MALPARLHACAQGTRAHSPPGTCWHHLQDHCAAAGQDNTLAAWLNAVCSANPSCCSGSTLCAWSCQAGSAWAMHPWGKPAGRRLGAPSNHAAQENHQAAGRQQMLCNFCMHPALHRKDSLHQHAHSRQACWRRCCQWRSLAVQGGRRKQGLRWRRHPMRRLLLLLLAAGRVTCGTQSPPCPT
jgi:hypothetical protein